MTIVLLPVGPPSSTLIPPPPLNLGEPDIVRACNSDARRGGDRPAGFCALKISAKLAPTLGS